MMACKKTVRGLVVALLLFATSTWAWGQAEMHSVGDAGLPAFYFDAVTVASRNPALSRINLFIKIAYDELQFIKEGDRYGAEYEVSAIVMEENGEQADGKIWKEKIEVSDYRSTNSRRSFSLTNADFELKPGKYRLSIGLMDLDTKRTSYRKSSLELKQYNGKELGISDITFANNIEVDSLGVKSILPDVSGSTRAPGSKLFAYFEVYCSLPIDSFKVFYEIHGSKGKEIAKGNYWRERTGYRTMDFVPIELKDVPHDLYDMKMWVEHGGYTAFTEKRFAVKWVGVPASISDLGLAIQQLRYITDQKEIKRLEKIQDKDRLREFQRFWKRRDPSPGTDENEIMDEYYRRVAYANANYGNFRVGWKTDMGMIFIIFGPPNDIERHPFDTDSKPYEIWYYYRINRQFVFVDYSGFGEYRLATPFHLDYRWY